ncbi:MAG: DNA cytosine methyltransferase [Nannocystaceae bacterium]
MVARSDPTPESQRPRRRIGFVDLFCGAGGLSYGLAKAGLVPLAGYDIDSDCEYSYTANNHAEFVQEDLASTDPAEVRARFRGMDFSVLAGCAPCQPFSTYARTRRSTDHRWRLLGRFGRIVAEAAPDVVTMENVEQLSHHNAFSRFAGTLERLGYSVWWSVVRCADFGVPQTRKRLVLLASRRGDITLQRPQERQTPTAARAIGNQPPLAAGQQDPDDPLHRCCRLSSKNLERIRSSEPGGSWRDWDKSLVAACHARATGDTYPSVYGRMRWDEPAPTMTTQYFGFGNGRFGHPDQDRAISLREGALLQTFPRTYRFERGGELLSAVRLGRLIGNAVPPQLARHIGLAIRRHLLG